MKKQFIFGCFVAFLHGCTSPPLSPVYLVQFQNACNYPVQVVVPKYADFEPLNQSLNTGDNELILRHYCDDNHVFFASDYKKLQKCLPDDYLFTISANKQQRTLNNVQLLDILKHIKRGSDSKNFWRIKDPSLCP
jgi:hypothetical protein